MINPVTPEAIATYKVEPYVLAADVYANTPCGTGRMDVQVDYRIFSRDAKGRG